MKKRNGFTLVEILIVVIILGILAAIVIPQFTDASEEAKLSSLVSDLQTVRSQIQLYKFHHRHGTASLPGTVGGVSFEDSMTKYTNIDGTVAATQAPDPNGGVYGPYLQKIPTNPFDNNVDVTAGAGSPPGNDDSGWYYNPITGAFNANDSAAHAAL
jgi:prepilin-type N-terminal cleavage/methylation domain-containing protein